MPAVAAVLVMVSAAVVALPVRLTEVGLTEQVSVVTPAGGAQVRATDPLKPFAAARFSVSVPDPEAATETIELDGIIEKSDSGLERLMVVDEDA